MSLITNPREELEVARSHALKFLLAARDQKEGWFPYRPGGDCSLEATAWALMATARQERQLAGQSALYLAKNQNVRNGWSTKPGAGKSDWNSGPVLLALRQVRALDPALDADGSIASAIGRGLNYLLDSRVEFYGPTARLLILISKGSKALAYARGWPWDPKCFHWIEPTTYCLLALKLPARPKNEVQRTIITQADKFILEHACKDGGWNHGNDLTLGSYLPPYRMTTAEALLALQDNRAHKAIEPALTYLQSQSADDSSSLSLALSILALQAYGRPFEKELAFLRKRQAQDGSFGPTVMSTALAALALEAAAGNNMLHITEQS